MKIKGTIKHVYDTVQVSDKFKKREFILTTEDQYPQHLLIQATQDKCEQLDSLEIGSQIECSINLRGREWMSPQGELKYFNSIEVWQFESKPF